MIKTEASNKFIQDTVLLAARFRNCGATEASDLMLDLARRVIQHPFAELKIEIFAHQIKLALWSAYGHEHALADLSINKQHECLGTWSWFAATTGEKLSKTLTSAINQYEDVGGRWSDRNRNIQRILDREPTRAGIESLSDFSLA